LSASDCHRGLEDDAPQPRSRREEPPRNAISGRRPAFGALPKLAEQVMAVGSEGSAAASTAVVPEAATVATAVAAAVVVAADIDFGSNNRFHHCRPCRPGEAEGAHVSTTSRAHRRHGPAFRCLCHPQQR
jgi:hypothetical protein